MWVRSLAMVFVLQVLQPWPAWTADAHVYESPSFVKKERIIRASVNLPFVYPSIGVSLAPVGCFEVALAAPSVNEPKAQ